MKKKILYLVTEDRYFYTHRLPLAKAMVEKGYQVFVVTRGDKLKAEFEKAGLKVIPFAFNRKGINPFKEVAKLIQLIKIYKKIKPDLVHHIAIKPVIHGSIAARIIKIPKVVNAIAGLGTVFSDNTFLTRMIRPVVNSLFRLLLNAPNSTVIIQNLEDQTQLEKQGVKKKQFVLIRGAGVDTDQFIFIEEPDEIPKIVLTSRMLWNKGIGELIEATRILRRENLQFEVWLVGDCDPGNLSSIPELTIKSWVDEGLVKWLGLRDDIAEIWHQSHIAVLPSYREGLPKSLLEAAACGKPIVTTDVPGCREVVKEGVNGFLVPAKDPCALAAALKKLIENPELRKVMGGRSRQIAEKEFSSEKVIAETLAIYVGLEKNQLE